ncbi:MAG: ATP-binding protein [Methanoregula sp.]|nr:ATP-binding protein [Methanoregula sp.]
MGSHVSFEIPAELDQIDRISHEIERCMKNVGMGEDEILDVQLAVEEAVTNTILHGYDGAIGIITIRIDTSPQHIAIEIADNAPAFDPLSMPDPDLGADLEDRKIGGLGIFLIRKVMDEVTYRYVDNKNILLMVKDSSQKGS